MGIAFKSMCTLSNGMVACLSVARNDELVIFRNVQPGQIGFSLGINILGNPCEFPDACCSTSIRWIGKAPMHNVIVNGHNHQLSQKAVCQRRSSIQPVYSLAQKVRHTPKFKLVRFQSSKL